MTPSRAEAPGAAAFIPDTVSLPALREASESCRGCELYRDATQSVMGDGPTNAPLMFIGEQPGDVEDREGAPFVGPAGRVLDSALDSVGLDRDEIFVTNAVKHFRFDQRGRRRIHKAPTVTQIRACQPWLAAEFDLIRPTGVVLLGASAGKSMFGSSFRLTEVRGQVQPWDVDDGLAGKADWWLATIHPSAVLRAENRAEVLDGLIADLTTAREKLSSTS
jgi:uracil-DNA glycosylase